MSHFSSIQTKLIDKQALVQGLNTLFTNQNLKINVEVYDSPVELINALEIEDKSQAEIIIRREQLTHNQRRAHLDVGFAYQKKTQSFEAILDNWDFIRNSLGHHFDTVQGFLDQVQLAHDQAYINIHYPADIWNHQVIHLEDGTIRTTLSKKSSLVSVSY
jgi:hypothetical protein